MDGLIIKFVRFHSALTLSQERGRWMGSVTGHTQLTTLLNRANSRSSRPSRTSLGSDSNRQSNWPNKVEEDMDRVNSLIEHISKDTPELGGRTQCLVSDWTGRDRTGRGDA